MHDSLRMGTVTGRFVVAALLLAAVCIAFLTFRAQRVGGATCGMWTRDSVPTPVTLNGDLAAVATTSASDSWAVGYAWNLVNQQRPVVEHWNGKAWSLEPFPWVGEAGDGGDGWLNSISARAPNDVWVGGGFIGPGSDEVAGSILAHWDGKTWTQSYLPESGPDNWTNSGHDMVNALVELSPDDVWEASGNDNGASLAHWNGHGWAFSDLPLLQGAALNAIDGTASSHIWSAGTTSDPDLNRLGQPLFERWNGHRWSGVRAAQTVRRGDILGLSALTAHNVWGVGYSMTRSGKLPLIEHWNGHRWALVPSPPLPKTQLESVHAISTDNVWASGGYEHPVGHFASVIEHWNGRRWSVSVSPHSVQGALSDLPGLSGVAGGPVWGVGVKTTTHERTLIERWTGSRWITVPSPNANVADATLVAVAGSSPRDVWVLGHYNPPDNTWKPFVDHWNGTAWRMVDMRVPSWAGGLAGLAVISPSDAWAVGDIGGQQPQIEHWNGRVWRAVHTPRAKDVSLQAVTGSSASDVWAAGWNPDYRRQGTYFHWNGVRWSIVSSSTTLIPNAIAARSSSDVWAVGQDGIAHWAGSLWTAVPFRDRSSQLLSAVVALARKDVWAAGYHFEHYDGTSWAVVPSPHVHASIGFDGIAAISPHDIWASGETGANFPRGFVEHWNGSAWSIAKKPERGAHLLDFAGVAAFRPRTVLVIGTEAKNGTSFPVVERYRECP